MAADFDIVRADPTGEEARALIAELNETMLAIYPPEHCHHMPPETLASREACFLMACDDDGALGCGAAVPLQDDTVEIKRFFTRPRARRTGAARAILTRLEDWARSQGYRSMVLETGSRSDAAIALYTGQGFTSRTPFGSYEATENNVFFEKTIAGDTAGESMIGQGQ